MSFESLDDMKNEISPENASERIHRERILLLAQVHKMSEPVLIVLGFVWLLLLVVDLIKGLSHQLLIFENVIWIIFILDFVLKLIIAPSKGRYLKENVLTIISLVIPALRIFRIVTFFRFFRILRATRSIRVARIITSVNRGMRSLNLTLRRRGFIYIMLLTIIVLFTGAGGMYAFENKGGINSYSYSVWWTAMIITTMGSQYWPKTSEGQFLCLVLAVYGFAIFGYITATIASFFVGRDAGKKSDAIANEKQLHEMKSEIEFLREILKNRS